MRHQPVSILAAGFLCACASNTTAPDVEYLPPNSPPANVSRSIVGQPSYLVWNQVLDHLQQSPLQLTHVDEQAGILVARYSGDPQPYVDCGWIVTHRPGRLNRIAASTMTTEFDRVVGERAIVLERTLRLDGRLVVRMLPQGDSTAVTADTTYVVSKVIDADGRGRNVDVVSFGTGGRGEFRKGTVCQPTGEFELAALAALPVVAGTAGAGTAVVEQTPAAVRETAPAEPVVREPPPEVAGEAPPPPALTPLSLECAGVDEAYCRLVEMLEPYREANEEQQYGLAIAPVDGQTVLEEGTELALDLGLPGFEAYIDVAYVQRDGSVGHILPGASRPWPAYGRRYVQDTGYEIAEPFGLEMIVAIATEVPVFPEDRPRFESAETYLADLGRRLEELRAAEPNRRIVASHVFVRTVAGSRSF